MIITITLSSLVSIFSLLLNIYQFKTNRQDKLGRDKITDNENKKAEIKKHFNFYIADMHFLRVSCENLLYRIKYDLNNFEDNKVEFLESLTDIQSTLYRSNNNIYILKSLLAKADLARELSKIYNELFFLVQYLEILIKKDMYKNDSEQNIEKFINDSDEIRKDINVTEVKIMQELVNLYPYMDIESDEFVVGTEYFNWYFKDYNYEIIKIFK